MTDIFLSYASPDRERVKPIVEALARQGWSVWWDRKIPFGKTFDQIIEEALDKAICVVVVWSRNSVKSEWVRNEAYEGLNRHILVPVLIDDVKIPLGFRRIQAARLVDWESGQGQVEFESLVETIKNIINENRDAKQLEGTEDKKHQLDILPEETPVEVLPEETPDINEDSETVESEPQIAQDVDVTENQMTSDLTHAPQQQEQEEQRDSDVEDPKIEPEKNKIEPEGNFVAGEVSNGKGASRKTFVLISVGVIVLIAVLIIAINSNRNSAQDSNDNLATSNPVATITPSPKLETSPTPLPQTTPTPASVEKIDVTGTWAVTFKLTDGEGSGSFTLRLKQSGDNLTVMARDNEGVSRGAWVAARNGIISGNRITFYLEGRGDDITYRGIIEGDTMKGTVSFGGTWRAKRL